MPTSTSFLPCVINLILFRHDLFLPNSAVIFCHSQISLICLIYVSLPNLYFYNIRSMFLKVLNKVDTNRLYKPKLFTIGLLPFVKLLELLAIDHSSSVRRIIFVSQWLKFSHVLVVLQLAWVCTSPQFSWITRFGLAPFPGCQGSRGIVPNGPASSVVSFQGLKC